MAVIASVAGETLFAALVTPIVLAFQTQFVLAVLSRTAVAWGSQRRGDHATATSEAVRAHAAHTLWGVAVGTVAYVLEPPLFYWLVPSLAGLTLSIPLSVASSRASWGRLTRRWGLFLIPEEVSPPPLLRAFLGEDGPATRVRGARSTGWGRRLTPPPETVTTVNAYFNGDPIRAAQKVMNKVDRSAHRDSSRAAARRGTSVPMSALTGGESAATRVSIPQHLEELDGRRRFSEMIFKGRGERILAH